MFTLVVPYWFEELVGHPAVLVWVGVGVAEGTVVGVDVGCPGMGVEVGELPLGVVGVGEPVVWIGVLPFWRIEEFLRHFS